MPQTLVKPWLRVWLCSRRGKQTGENLPQQQVTSTKQYIFAEISKNSSGREEILCNPSDKLEKDTMQQECSLGRVWLEIFWVKKYLNRIRFSDTRKDVTHTSAGDTTASSCEKSMKDSFPKSFDVPMSTKPHSLSNLSRAFSCYWKQIESKWLCARSIQRLSVLGWEKKQTVTSGVLFRRMCHRGGNSPQHQKELHIKTTNFIFFSLYFQVYLCSTELTGLICRGMKRHLENSKNSTRALKIFFF